MAGFVENRAEQLKGYIKGAVASDQILLEEMGFSTIKVFPKPISLPPEQYICLYRNAGTWAIQRVSGVERGQNSPPIYRLDLYREGVIRSIDSCPNLDQLHLLDILGVPTIRSMTLQAKNGLLVARRLPFGQSLELDPFSMSLLELAGRWDRIIRGIAAELDSVQYPEPI